MLLWNYIDFSKEKHVDVLQELYDNVPVNDTAGEQARYCVDVLKPQMEEVRALSDTTERMVSADLWPYPKYSITLYSRCGYSTASCLDQLGPAPPDDNHH